MVSCDRLRRESQNSHVHFRRLKDQVGSPLEPVGGELKSAIVLRHCRAHHLQTVSHACGGIPQGQPVLLDRAKHKQVVLLQLLVSVLQGEAVLRHRSEYDVNVHLQPLAGGTKGHPPFHHHAIDELAVLHLPSRGITKSDDFAVIFELLGCVIYSKRAQGCSTDHECRFPEQRGACKRQGLDVLLRCCQRYLRILPIGLIQVLQHKPVDTSHP
mmetsp:Transcript_55917/g.120997  ORF Transcript_55917/g.120997 Transcript_55917/m.120997 type:complete len:213 (+) Transcript_55917:769-1407(+)